MRHRCAVSRAGPGPLRLIVGLVAGVLFVACGDLQVSTEPPLPDVAGEWAGSITLEGRVPRSVAMSLVQTGSTVRGSMSLEGALTAADLQGTVDARGILRWGSHDDDCDFWTGQLSIFAEPGTLAGPAQVNETLCDGGAVVTGSMSVDRR